MAPPCPTKFLVQSNEERKRLLPHLIVGLTLIMGGLYYIDPNIQREVLWILGGLAVGLVTLETAPLKRNVELGVEIGPLGIQRTTKVNDRIDYHPLLPRDCVRDCIVVEHIQAFTVSSHVVFRLGSGVVAAFPNANLTFRQCQKLVDQMQQAMKET